MNHEEMERILNKSYSIPVIDDSTIRGILNHPRFFRGHVRTAIGSIYKTGEFEKRSDNILKTKLP